MRTEGDFNIKLLLCGTLFAKNVNIYIYIKNKSNLISLGPALYGSEKHACPEAQTCVMVESFSEISSLYREAAFLCS